MLVNCQEFWKYARILIPCQIKIVNSCISGKGESVLFSAHLHCMELCEVVFWTQINPQTAQICCVILKLNGAVAADCKGLKLLIPKTATGQNPEPNLLSFHSYPIFLWPGWWNGLNTYKGPITYISEWGHKSWGSIKESNFLNCSSETMQHEYRYLL